MLVAPECSSDPSRPSIHDIGPGAEDLGENTGENRCGLRTWTMVRTLLREPVRHGAIWKKLVIKMKVTSR